MAIFKLGFGIADIRGKIGTSIFSIQKTGVSTIRQQAQAISNPMSAAQGIIRCSLAALSKAWGDDLDQTERDSWNTWALTKPGMGVKDGGILQVIKGNNGIMSGMNAFILANQWLKSINKPQVSTAPIGATPPTAPTLVTATWTTPNIVVDWTDPVTQKANAKVRIWIASHQPGCHRQLYDYYDGADETGALSSYRGAQGGRVYFITTPGDYIIQMDTVDVDGTKSGPSNVAQVKVTNP